MSWSGLYEEEKISCPSQESNPRCPARSLVAILTELTEIYNVNIGWSILIHKLQPCIYEANVINGYNFCINILQRTYTFACIVEHCKLLLNLERTELTK
jgi:hypothetical protein